jgi:hypothetical protein
MAFFAALAAMCYYRPVQDDFDRYIYEAIVRDKSQPIEEIYNIVKHESPRAEASSVLDSPEHLRELEPLYAIRPLYIEAIRVISRVVPIQHAINFLSAVSLFAIGIVVLLWTKQPLLGCLLISASSVLGIGRVGTPDALAALLAIFGLWFIAEDIHPAVGLLVLFLSLGVRTDNLLLLLAVLVWLVWKEKVPGYIAALLALLGIATVLAINHFAGNYGWVVLFRYSFVGGRYPSQVAHTLTLREYALALAQGAMGIFSQVALWILLAIIAWKRRPAELLVVVAVAAAAHFVLFPSPESRYFIWAFVVIGVELIRGFTRRETTTPEPANQVAA